MDTTPDEVERARAAVAIACLRWLQCAGPEPFAIEPPRRDSRSARPIRQETPTARLSPAHPLWDRWLDG